MTTNPNASSFALARQLMDRALDAPSGIRVTFRPWPGPGPCPPDKPSDLPACKAHADRLQRALHGARAASRRTNVKVFADHRGIDSMEELLSTPRKDLDPDAIRTVYDSLSSWIEPGGTSESPAVVLVIAKPNVSALEVEDF